MSLDPVTRSQATPLLVTAESGDGGVPNRLVPLLDAVWSARSAWDDPAPTMEVAP
jgi:hypothetical protein